VVNVTLKSGTNQYHGSIFEYLRNNDLNANSWANNARGVDANGHGIAPRPGLHYNRFGFTFGGPIVRNKLFFFASGEYEPLDAPRAITITPANAAALGLAASDLGSAPFAQRFQTYLGRLDYQFSPKNSVYVRYSNFVTPSNTNSPGS